MFYSSEYESDLLAQPQTTMVNDENKRPIRPTSATSAKPNKQLPEKAIRLMNAWYLAHEDNPYPNRQDLDYLATNGGIKESQVKAWFSNKRNRTQNTHPKRAKRYLVRNQLQTNASPSTWDEPEKIYVADQLEQRTQQQSLPANPTPILSYPQWSWFPTGYAYDYSTPYYYQTHPPSSQ